jgi:hypothetical protein
VTTDYSITVDQRMAADEVIDMKGREFVVRFC